MAWRSSGNNNSEMVDKLTRKQPIMCHYVLDVMLSPFVALFCICNAFLCILLLAAECIHNRMGDRLACVVVVMTREA